MSNGTHYLERELNDIFQNDSGIWGFFQQASLDGVWFWDLENPENLWISPEYWRLLGMDPSDKTHSPDEFIKVVFEQDLAKVMANLEQHYDDPSIPYEQEVRFKHSDGSTVWVRCRGVAIRDDQGKAIRMLGAHNDLTKEKKAIEQVTKAKAEADAAIAQLDREKARLNSVLRKLELVTDGSKDGFWYWYDTTKDEEEWSDSFFRLLGYSPGEIKPSFTNFQAMLHPDDYERTLLAADDAIEADEVFETEYRLRTKSGEYRWFNCRATPYFVEETQVVEMAGSISDIHDRKLLEQSLSDSNVRNDLAVRGLSVGIWDWDVPTGKLYLSPRLKYIVGLGEGKEWTFDEFVTRLHPEDKDRTLEQVTKHLQQESPYEIEYRLRHTAGHYIWIKAMGQACWDDELNPLRMVGSVEDISFRKKADLERQQLIADLARSSEFSNAILNSSKHLLIATDEQGLVTQFNRAAELTLGYSANEIVGKATPAVWHDAGETVARANELSQELGRAIEPGFDVFTLKVRMDGQETKDWTFIRKDGSRFPVSLTVTSIKDSQGRVTGYLGVIEDISERQQKAQELQRAKQNAEVANIAKSRFLASMSHEIRTPMNGVLGTLQLLNHEIKDKGAKKLLHNALISSNSLLTILNDILDFSKIEANMLSLENIEFSITQLLDQVSSSLMSNSRAKKLSFNTVIPESLHDVWLGDPVRVKQILNNLISNAIKFTEQGTVTVSLQTVERGAKQNLLLRVEDTGIGMSESALEGLFEHFTQADSSTTRKYGGTGLGMAITHSLVLLMGGEIKVQSELAVGTVFEVLLPLPQSQKQLPVEQSLTAVPNLAGKKILVAEDNLINQTIISSILKKTGVEFEIADNGQSALDKFHTFEPDVVLMDIEMPELDGVAACRSLREQNQGLPIIAITANVMSEDVENYLNSGFTEHLAKPIVVDKLYKKLSLYLS